MFFSFLLSGNQVMQIRQEGSQANGNTSVNIFSKSLSISSNTPGFNLSWGRRHHLSPSLLLSEDTPGLSETPLNHLLPWRFDFQSTLMGTLSPSASFPQHSQLFGVTSKHQVNLPWKKKCDVLPWNQTWVGKQGSFLCSCC